MKPGSTRRVGLFESREIEADLVGHAHFGIVNRPRRNQQSERRARNRQHHAFGQQLPDHAPAPCPERRANGNLLLSTRRARQLEVRDRSADLEIMSAYSFPPCWLTPDPAIETCGRNPVRSILLSEVKLCAYRLWPAKCRGDLRKGGQVERSR